MTRRTGAQRVAIAALAVCLGGCALAGSGATLEELGATDLAGQGGEGLDARCTSLPTLDGQAWGVCGQAGTSETRSELSGGKYVALLLCDGPGSYRLEAEDPADAFEPVEVECPEGADPAIAPEFTVASAGVRAMRETWTGEGHFRTVVTRVTEATG